MTYYRNLARHPSGKEEGHLDALVAAYTGNPLAGIGCPRAHEYPRIWLADCTEDLAEQLDHYLIERKLIREQS